MEVVLITLEEATAFESKVCKCKGKIMKIAEVIQQRVLRDFIQDENMERNFLAFEENFEYYNILVEME